MNIIKPAEKKFCRICGRRLVSVEKAVRYNEYTGEREYLTAIECPDQGEHVDAILDGRPI